MILDLGVQKVCNLWTEHTTMLSQLLTAALSSVPYFLQAVAVSPPDARSYQMDPHRASLDKSVSAKRPNSNLVAPPITVTVPAPVASTTASISFFLSCLAELSLSPLVPSNL